ncbi:MAG: Rid family detoxifying hydrolase [Rhodospirillales bacterium]|jgi:2-iminobutanoate/2-iminopropanoate deaminase|nr:Rid family detoxifying hydrolase [Rhodospirillales bacterium]
MPARQAIATDQAPAAVGPYSQAVRSGNLLFLSGQLGLDSATGVLVGPGVADEARQALRNLAAVLAAAAGGMGDVVKSTIYLTDMQDFAAVNAVYAEFFAAPFPARACVAVAALPKGGRVEIEAVAVLA